MATYIANKNGITIGQSFTNASADNTLRLDVPGTPTIGTPTAGAGFGAISFTASATGGAATSFIVTVQPRNTVVSGSASPINVPLVGDGTSYTATVVASNASGLSSPSATSNSFTPTQGGQTSISIQYLVVAGGGGGGSVANDNFDRTGGGGGAGGFQTETGFSIRNTTNYLVSVGSGGSVDTNGSNSIFSSITSIGGGAGGKYITRPDGNPGGSGGGGFHGGFGGLGNSNQGNNGGSGYNSGDTAGNFGAAGGGGAGNAGGSAQGIPLVAGVAGIGGNGIASSISGTSITYAGGGGGGGQDMSNNGVFYVGGAGGTGGGGRGGTGGTYRQATSLAVAGTPNLGGGGGGGGGAVGTAAAGGSGVVILKYPDTYTINIGSGLTGSTPAASGGFKVTTFTAGTGLVSFI
jgi:hypothetical protein